MKAAPLLLGLAAAAALTAEAEGCRIHRTDYRNEPVIADFVRSAGSIQLARVTHIEFLPIEERSYGSLTVTHRYTFHTVTHIAGEAVSTFSINGAAPLENINQYDCGASFEGAEYEYWEERIIQSRICNAERGHRDWNGLIYQTTIREADGIGGLSNYDAPEGVEGILVGGCGRQNLSFAAGETFLVFLDRDGNVVPGSGLNLRLIRSPYDAWFAAVRYLVDNPLAEWLPARPAEDVVRTLDLLGPAASECDEYELPYCDPEDDRLWARFSDTPWNDGIPPTPFLIPVESGLVNLTALPVQHEIEPRQVPLDDFNAWIAAHD